MTSVRLGVVSDVHLVFAGSEVEGSRVPDPEGWDFAATEGALQAVVDRFAQEDLDGVVVLGDLSHHGDDATLDRAFALLTQLERALWAAPGNHDVGLSADAVGRALERAGRSPAGGPVSVLEIESEDWIMSCRARTVLPDDAAVVASHYPLVPRSGKAASPDHLVDGSEQLARLLARTGPTVVLSGHLHVRDAYANGPVLQLIFPALIESPAECSILELAPGRVRSIALGSDASEELWEFDGAWVCRQIDTRRFPTGNPLA
jgi:3',5'-cyclic AMP phosphodiesterase CpdA